MMSGTVMSLRRKLSGWELREKTKTKPIGNSREELTASESTTSSTSSLPVSDPDEQAELPPAFRSIKAGHVVRRNSAIRPSMTSLDRKVSPLIPPLVDKGKDPTKKKTTSTKTKELRTIKKAKPEKEAKIKKKSKSDASQEKKASDTWQQKEEKLLKKELKMPLRQSAKMKKLQRTETRKSVLESLGKFELTQSPKQRMIRAPLKRDPYASRSPENPDELSDESISLDDLPPPEREDRVAQSLGDKCSVHSRSLSSFNASMDLSGHRMLPVYEQVKTSASDDQWARFKLLGRLGLGDIKLSREAQVLVERNYCIMLHALKHIYAMRDEEFNGEASLGSLDFGNFSEIKTGHLLEEVQTTINVSMEGPARLKRDPNTIEVDPIIKRQLRDFIVVICSLYRDNPFHDFEHASTVLQAVDKVIGLVSYPDEEFDYRNLKHGCGVAREPWNHFALVFAAMIHDVDHSGVPNAQLVKEGSHVAGAYKNKSVAEQNSIELAWNLLMEPCYKELRKSIFQFRAELVNFRSLVVTAVMATDIADKELAALRKGRAADALKAQDEKRAARANMDLVRRKATFVVETLIQVADVSHTMSSFDVFKKWNHRLYREMYKAYKNGRASQDPTETWYKGEFGFFDFYIIPLAKKLNECGIYGEASEEYLNNAINNRKLWEEKGEALVSKYVTEIKKEEAEMDEGRANQPSKSRKISLRDMVLDDWSSSEESSVQDFAEDSDDDSVSISSDDAEDRKQSRLHSNLAAMRHHLTAMTAGSGRVPSKASIEMRVDKSICRRSKSANPEEMAKMLSGFTEGEGHGRKIRLRSRSQSPSGSNSNLGYHHGNSPNTDRDDEDGDSTSDEGGRPLRSRSRSRSPGSGSETGQPKSILKNKSPGSGSERSQTRSILKSRLKSQPLPDLSSDELKPKAATPEKKSISRSRSRSPASKPPTPEPSKSEQRQPRSGRKVRRGRRPSRSRSPASSIESGASGERKRKTDLKKGKRPSMIKS